VFKGELVKFYEHDRCADYFSRPEQGLEEPSIHYFNNFYFLGMHPNLTSIACYGTHQHVEEVVTYLNVHNT
jgi:hypothetical protein